MDTAYGSRLILDRVGLSRQGRVILRDISLELRFGRLGIVGRNGSGKSTLAHLIAGVIRTGTGEIRINDVDVSRDRRAALFEIGLLFQIPDHQLIFPTVIEEMCFGLIQMGRSRDQAHHAAKETLIAFGKAHWESAHVAALSQGQKSLLCLMAVVAMSPRVLILDEPLAGLDIPTRAQLVRYLDRYRGDLVHVTHRVEDLAGYDQALWIDGGQVVQSGAAEPVLDRYSARMEEAGQTDDIADLSG